MRTTDCTACRDPKSMCCHRTDSILRHTKCLWLFFPRSQISNKIRSEPTEARTMNTSDINRPTTEPHWSGLFATIKSKIANEKWDPTTSSPVTTSYNYARITPLRPAIPLYLRNQHAYSTTTAHSELIRWICGALFKGIALSGSLNPPRHSSVFGNYQIHL